MLKEKRRYWKQYYNKNKEKILADNKKWNEEHKDFLKKSSRGYYSKHKSKFIEYNKKWRKRNREKSKKINRDSVRKWREKHRDRVEANNLRRKKTVYYYYTYGKYNFTSDDKSQNWPRSSSSKYLDIPFKDAVEELKRRGLSGFSNMKTRRDKFEMVFHVINSLYQINHKYKLENSNMSSNNEIESRLDTISDYKRQLNSGEIDLTDPCNYLNVNKINEALLKANKTEKTELNKVLYYLNTLEGHKVHIKEYKMKEIKKSFKEFCKRLRKSEELSRKYTDIYEWAHYKGGRYKCLICGKIYKNKKDVIIHLLSKGHNVELVDVYI